MSQNLVQRFLPLLAATAKEINVVERHMQRKIMKTRGLSSRTGAVKGFLSRPSESTEENIRPIFASPICFEDCIVFESFNGSSNKRRRWSET